VEQSSIFKIVLDASLEVRSQWFNATFIVALVFVPVLMMSACKPVLRATGHCVSFWPFSRR